MPKDGDKAVCGSCKQLVDTYIDDSQKRRRRFCDHQVAEALPGEDYPRQCRKSYDPVQASDGDAE